MQEASARDWAWLQRAAKAAALSSGRSKHGAIVVRGGSVLAVAVNKSRTHDVWVTNRPRSECSIHAECAALNMVANPRGTTVYVVRVDAKGNWKNSKPCAACAQVLEDKEVRRVVFSMA